MQSSQLGLFSKRTRKTRSAPEFSLHVMVADILERWATTGWRWTHLPFGEHRNPITGGRLKRMGTKKGWPDFILLSPSITVDNEVDVQIHPGRPHFLELKRKGAYLTPEQYELMHWMTGNGYHYKVCDNFNDAIFVLKNWGAVRASVSA